MAQSLVYGIDVGTTKIVAIAGRVDDRRGWAEVLSVGEAPSHGLKRGIVVDREAATESVLEAIEDCEGLPRGGRGGEVSVGVAGSHISSVNTEVTLLNRSRNRTITERFVKRLEGEAKQIELGQDKKVIHVVPRSFVLDGAEGATQPVGLAARKVTMRAHVVAGSISSIQNLLGVVEDCGVKVSRVVLEPLASSEACLLNEDRRLGAALIDIGGGTVDDVAAVMLGDKHFNARFMSQILEYRAREVLEYVRDSLDKAGVRNLLPGGAVLTGGGSLLGGTSELAEKILGMRTRTAAPRHIKGDSDPVRRPQ